MTRASFPPSLSAVCSSLVDILKRLEEPFLPTVPTIFLVVVGHMEGQKDALTMQIEAAVKKQRDMESQVAERDKRLSQALTMKDALTEQLDAERRRSEVAAKQEAERDAMVRSALVLQIILPNKFLVRFIITKGLTLSRRRKPRASRSSRT